MFQKLREAISRKKKSWSEPPPSECKTSDTEQEEARSAYEQQLAQLKDATRKRKSRTLSDVRQRMDSSDALMREALTGGKP